MSNSVFDKVLFIGPDIKGKGGISSVLASYEKMMPKFHYLSSNSRFGTFLGAVMLIRLLLLLPYFKWIKKIEIAHVHGATRKSFVRKRIIMRCLSFLGYKIVYHSHGAEFKEYAQQVGFQKMSKILSNCSRVVVLSNEWRLFFQNELNLNNVVVVNNIVEPVDGVQENCIGENDVIKFLFLGLIGYRKGIFDLLSVLNEHKHEYENRIKLVVGGNGEVEKLQSYVKDNELSNIVDYRGWISGEEKARLLKECNVVILPSYNEGLPIFILEAMANAKPIISTTVGGIPGVVKDNENGFLHKPGDKNAIYEAIGYFIENKDALKTFGNKSIKKVVPFYSHSVKMQLEKLYKSILG